MIFAIYSLLALGALANILSSVSTHRKAFDPATTIKANYESINRVSGNQLQAKFSLGTKKPSVNIANFDQIIGVECKSLYRVNLVFVDVQSAQVAFQSWNGTSLVLYLDHAYKCGGSNTVQAVKTVSLVLKEKAISVSTIPIGLKDFIQDFEMAITKAQLGSPVRIPVGFNYDIQTLQIKNPSISMFQNNIATGACSNCYGNGSVDFEFTMKGSYVSIKEYAFKLNGLLDATVDIELNLQKSGDITVFRKRLYEHSFGNLTVPGILDFNPTAILETAIALQTDQSGSVTFGADATVPIAFEAKSTNGLFGQPVFKSSGIPTIRPHPLTIQNGKVGVEGHITPLVTLDILVFQIPAFDFLLTLDNAMGMELTSDGKGCFGTSIYRHHLFGYKAASDILNWNKRAEVYNSGKVPIDCPMCAQCSATG